MIKLCQIILLEKMLLHFIKYHNCIFIFVKNKRLDVLIKIGNRQGSFKIILSDKKCFCVYIVSRSVILYLHYKFNIVECLDSFFQTNL